MGAVLVEYVVFGKKDCRAAAEPALYPQQVLLCAAAAAAAVVTDLSVVAVATDWRHDFDFQILGHFDWSAGCKVKNRANCSPMKCTHYWLK